MPRTHRGKERFPGMTITYALMTGFEEAAEQSAAAGNWRAKIINRARVYELICSGPAVVGCKYELKGENHTVYVFLFEMCA